MLNDVKREGAVYGATGLKYRSVTQPRIRRRNGKPFLTGRSYYVGSRLWERSTDQKQYIIAVLVFFLIASITTAADADSTTWRFICFVFFPTRRLPAIKALHLSPMLLMMMMIDVLTLALVPEMYPVSQNRLQKKSVSMEEKQSTPCTAVPVREGTVLFVKTLVR